MHRGPIPDGMCVLHRCDVPHCVNPAHLFLGTKSQNQQDMAEKGRGHKRASRAEARLKSAADRVKAGERQRDVAEKMGIDASTLSSYRRANGGDDLRHLRGVKALIELDGRSMSLSQWARSLGISYQAIQKRIGRGWTLRRALTTT